MSAFDSALRGLVMRVKLVIGRGHITQAADGGNVQRLQVQLGANEVRDNTPRLAEYGLASMPPAGSDAVVVFVEGDRSNGVIIATGNQTLRVKNLKSGETALYDAVGKVILLAQDKLSIDAKGQPVEVNNATTVTVNASSDVTVNAGGNAKVVGASGVTIESPESVNINGAAGVSIKTDGDAVAEISGSLTATASGPITLSAPSINL